MKSQFFADDLYWPGKSRPTVLWLALESTGVTHFEEVNRVFFFFFSF
jgi:hypothetical protein